MTYEATTSYRRTAAQMVDQRLSWDRPDRNFFAAGGCHILAWAFLSAYPLTGFLPVGLRRVGSHDPFHVFVTDGSMAFDYAGWTARVEVLEVTRAALAAERPASLLEQINVPGDLDEFCATYNHRLPSQFIEDPRGRAHRYLQRSDPPPNYALPTRDHRWDSSS